MKTSGEKRLNVSAMFIFHITLINSIDAKKYSERKMWNMSTLLAGGFSYIALLILNLIVTEMWFQKYIHGQSTFLEISVFMYSVSNGHVRTLHSY